MKMSKKSTAIITALFSLTALVTTIWNAQADQIVPMKFSIALIGDMPYDAKGVTQTPNVIADINANPNLIKFSLFDGDTMSGKGDKCTDENYARIKKDFFDQFTNQVFYSVGDNEWVDCDRAVKGAYDANERLAKVRSIFFGNATSGYVQLGKNKAGASTVITRDPEYPEMQMFSYRGITFILPHVPGSANNAAVSQPTYKTYNDKPQDGDDAEYKARDAANVAWINAGFAKAKAENSIGVIVVVQADMDWEGFSRDQAVPNNEYSQAFANVKQALLTNTLAFKKPVLLQNGDQHWYQVDMPMNETAGKLVERDKGSLVENFTRVQTFGSGFNHWVELQIDPKNPNLWTFVPHIIGKNVDTHTA